MKLLEGIKRLLGVGRREWVSLVLIVLVAGAAWALACWLVARHLQRTGRIDADPEEPEDCVGSAG